MFKLKCKVVVLTLLGNRFSRTKFPSKLKIFKASNPITDVIFNSFADSVDGYKGISYFINSNGVIKDLDAKQNNETIYAITRLDELTIENEKKRRIKVIRPNRVVEFASLYFSKVV